MWGVVLVWSSILVDIGQQSNEIIINIVKTLDLILKLGEYEVYRHGIKLKQTIMEEAYFIKRAI